MKPFTAVWWTVFLASLAPCAWLLTAAATGRLTANPIEFLTHETGWYALTWLMLSLAVTPIRRLSGWNNVIKLRRMLGLFAFFYASLHLGVWVGLDRFFDVPFMVEDVIERRFITAGMATWALMLPLALTSTTGMIRRLGRRWRQLHRLAYVAAVGGVVHYWWLVKADTRGPLRFAVVLAVLLGLRVWWSVAARARAARPGPARA